MASIEETDDKPMPHHISAWEKFKNASRTSKMLAVIALTASDVGSDMYSALSFFRSGNVHWAISTIYLVFQPFFVTSTAWMIKFLVEKYKVLRQDQTSDDEIEMTSSTTTIEEGSSPTKPGGRALRRWIPSWNNPIWHLPFFQLANYARFTEDLIQIAAERQNCLDDLTCLEWLRFLGEDLVDPLRKHCGERALQLVTTRQSKVEGNYLRVRMIEAIFESGPQFIMQLAIIIKTGNVEYHQLVSIGISLLSFWYSTTQFMLEMPTVKTHIRTSTFMDYINVFVPSFFITLVRLSAWSFLLAYLDILVVLPIVVTIALPAFLARKDLTFTDESDFIDLVAAALMPCTVKNEYSSLYLKTNLWTTLPMMASLFLTLAISSGIDGQPPILKCFDNATIPAFADNWLEDSNGLRCWYNQDGQLMTDICTDVWITLGANSNLVGGVVKFLKDYRTICNSNTEHIVYGCLVLLAVGLLLSLGFAYCWLQPYLDPFSRIKYFFKPSWNQFYQTKLESVQKLLASPSSSSQYEQLLLTAVADNIDSLVRYILLDRSDIVRNITLTTQAVKLAKHNGNDCLLKLLENVTAKESEEGQGDQESDSDVDLISDGDDFPKLELHNVKADIRLLHERLKSLGQNPLTRLIKSNENATLKKVIHYHDQLALILTKLAKLGRTDLSNSRLEEVILEFLVPIYLFEATKNNKDAERLLNHHKEHILMLNDITPPQVERRTLFTFYRKVAIMCLVVTLAWMILIPCLFFYLPPAGLQQQDDSCNLVNCDYNDCWSDSQRQIARCPCRPGYASDFQTGDCLPNCQEPESCPICDGPFYDLCLPTANCSSQLASSNLIKCGHNALCCGKSAIFNTLLVATGYPYNNSRMTEAIHLSKSKTCTNIIENFPVQMVGATGEVLRNQQQAAIVVCGGRGSRYDSLSENCYSLTSRSQQWIQVEANLTEHRIESASIVIENGRTLWVTGGYGATNRLALTDFVSLVEQNAIAQLVSLSVKPGPDLPVALSYHCIVKLNSSTAMLIGGYGEVSVLDSTYYLDIPDRTKAAESAKSIQGPDLIVPRYDHSCGVLTDPGDGNHQVVVVTGGGAGIPSKSTEMLAVGSGQGWTIGPDLPMEIDQGSGVTSPDGKSFYVVGGNDDEYIEQPFIYQLEFHATNGVWQWTKQELKLQTARSNALAMLVPDSFC